MEHQSTSGLVLPLVLLTLAALQFASAEDLTVVAVGESHYVIALAEQSRDPVKLDEAATLLQPSIRKANGVEFPVVKESLVGEPWWTECLQLGGGKPQESGLCLRGCAGVRLQELAGGAGEVKDQGKEREWLGRDHEGLGVPSGRSQLQQMADTRAVSPTAVARVGGIDICSIGVP